MSQVRNGGTVQIRKYKGKEFDWNPEGASHVGRPSLRKLLG